MFIWKLSYAEHTQFPNTEIKMKKNKRENWTNWLLYMRSFVGKYLYDENNKINMLKDALDTFRLKAICVFRKLVKKHSSIMKFRGELSQ